MGSEQCAALCVLRNLPLTAGYSALIFTQTPKDNSRFFFFTYLGTYFVNFVLRWINVWHDLSEGQARLSLPTNNKTTENGHKFLPRYKFIHSCRFLLYKSSPTNFNALRTCYISVRNIYERFCNLAHMGLSQSHAPLTEIWLSPHRARFMLVLFLFCCLTFWTSTFGIQTTNFFLMVVRRTSEW